MSDWKSHLRRACDLMGSQQKLACALGCSQTRIAWLLSDADELPVEDALKIHHLTGGRVSARVLRPDWIWPSTMPKPPKPKRIAGGT